MTAVMTPDRLRGFSDAWDRGDVELVMSFFAPDCVFSPSVEAQPGLSFHGKAAVEAEIRRILARDADGISRSGDHVVLGNRGYSEWSLVYRYGDEDLELRGCDIFEFSGDLIVRKDAFRKSALWLPE
jgi:SnoaL-like domain